jgi:outer membrane lipoprotein-sorting protein
MIKYLFLLASIFSLSFVSAKAQSNTEAVNLLSNIMNDVKTTAIKTDFKLTMTIKGNPSQTLGGSFTLKANKFVLDMNLVKVYFNGITQWSYMSQNNEVTISTPSTKELSETNPMSILINYSLKSNINFSSETKSSKNHCIEMKPKSIDKDISKIIVQINKVSNELQSIKINYKNGNVNYLVLNSFKKGVQLSDSYFDFNKANFKGVIINDLR